MKENPFVSIIIPAYNSSSVIASCIESCLNQTYPKDCYEIIVVDDGSTDNTSLIVRNYRDVSYIYQKKRGPAAARNLGYKHSQGEIIVFFDADCMPEKDCLAKIVADFKQHPEIMCVGTRYGISNPGNILADCLHSEFQARYSRMPDICLYVGSHGYAFRRPILEELGGHNEEYTINSAEDNDLIYRLIKRGYKPLFDKNIVVYHRFATNLFSYLKTQFKHGIWRMKLYKDHPKMMQGDQYSTVLDFSQPPLGVLLLISLPLTLFFGALWIPLSLMLVMLLLQLPLAILIYKSSSSYNLSLIYIPLGFFRAIARGIGMICGIARFWIGLNQRRVIYPLIILIIASSLRLILVSKLPMDAPDSSSYEAVAHNLVKGEGFKDAAGKPEITRAPGYPFFLALCYKLFSEERDKVRIAQAFLDSFTAIFLYLILLCLFKNYALALLGGLIISIYPEVAACTSYILSETLTAFLLTASILILIYGVSKKRWYMFIFAGVSSAFAALTRPVILLFPIFLLFISFIIPKYRKYLIFLLLFSLTSFLTILPWSIRNYLAVGKFIPITRGFASNLWTGSYLPWDGDWNYKDLSAYNNIIKGLPVEEWDRAFLKEAIKNISASPFGYLLLCVKKLFRFWFLVPGSKEVLKGKESLLFILYLVHLSALLFFIFGLITIFLGEKNYDFRLICILSVIFYFTFFHTLLLAIPRYRIPVLPMFLFYSTYGFHSFLKLFRKNYLIKITPKGGKILKPEVVSSKE